MSHRKRCKYFPCTLAARTSHCPQHNQRQACLCITTACDVSQFIDGGARWVGDVVDTQGPSVREARASTRSLSCSGSRSRSRSGSLGSLGSLTASASASVGQLLQSEQSVPVGQNVGSSHILSLAHGTCPHSDPHVRFHNPPSQNLWAALEESVHRHTNTKQLCTKTLGWPTNKRAQCASFPHPFPRGSRPLVCSV